MLDHSTNKSVLVYQVSPAGRWSKQFDYLPLSDLPAHLELAIGTLVKIPWGKKECWGIITGEIQSSNVDPTKLRRILEAPCLQPVLPPTIIKLAQWTSNYYHYPLGEVLAYAIPTLLRNGKHSTAIPLSQENPIPQPALAHQTYSTPLEQASLNFNPDQQKAFDALRGALESFKVFLLDGVTGSGKTEVYLRIIAQVIQARKQALVLVPEINLTPQTVARFTARFPGVTISLFHSRLSPKQKLQTWQAARDGTTSIIIGTRSAIFIPLKHPGIIVVDEEHDPSFKQQTGLRYSARDLAIVRGKNEQLPIVLGSATPALESLHNAAMGRYTNLALPERAGGASPPKIELIDMRAQKLSAGLSAPLLDKIKTHLQNQGQVLLFINRRGFATIVVCHECGWMAECPDCDARLTLHLKHDQLRCHHCHRTFPLHKHCPKCQGEKLLTLGFGTERIETKLKELLPETRIARIDSDTTTSKKQLYQLLDDIHKTKYQLLIGTQMLAKGHHFPEVTMVAILNIDQGLFGTDFRASEHLAQLIVQVSGRAGRATRPGEVYLQTHNPDHPFFKILLRGGYNEFAAHCLIERKLAELPPYSHLALLQAESPNIETATDFLNNLKGKFQVPLTNLVQIMGPVPALMGKKAGYLRMQLLLRSNRRHHLQYGLGVIRQALNEVTTSAKLRWFLDVDPLDL